MKEVDKFIEANKTKFNLKPGTSSSEISNAEQELGFRFDSDYQAYIKKYGVLSYESMELKGLGVSKVSYLNVVSATLDLKNENDKFPINTVVLEDIGENNFVVYSMNEGVFQYSIEGLELIKPLLEEFLLMRFSEESRL